MNDITTVCYKSTVAPHLRRMKDELGELIPDSSFIIVLWYGVGDKWRRMSEEKG